MILGSLFRFDGKIVRVTMKDGLIFQGRCMANSAEYTLHEFGVEEQSLEIDDYLLYRRDMKTVKLLRRSDD